MNFLAKLLLALRSVSSKKRKEKRLRAIQKCQVVRFSLSLSLSLSYVLSLSELSLAKIKSKCSSDQKRNLFFPFASYLLAYCLAEGASVTADGTESGGGVATLIAGLARPNPRQQYGCNFHQGVPCQTFSSFWNDNTRSRRKGKTQDYAPYEDARSHAPVFCKSSLSRDSVFCRRKDWLSVRSEMKPFLSFCKLLACLLPCRGRKPDRRRSRRRRRCRNADRGLNLPNPLASIGL